MQHGIKTLAENNFGRVEIIDQQEYAQLTIRPTKQTVEKIEALEELTMAAELQLGNFVVGSASR
jgi:predicted metal-dependent TIM-barrel fold hydrolase